MHAHYIARGDADGQRNRLNRVHYSSYFTYQSCPIALGFLDSGFTWGLLIGAENDPSMRNISDRLFEFICESPRYETIRAGRKEGLARRCFGRVIPRAALKHAHETRHVYMPGRCSCDAHEPRGVGIEF